LPQDWGGINLSLFGIGYVFNLNEPVANPLEQEMHYFQGQTNVRQYNGKTNAEVE
jgi:hypothetical protein